jgi:hypothetical protein
VCQLNITFVATEAKFSCFYLLYWMEAIVELHAMATLTLGGEKKSLSAIGYEARWFSNPVGTF